MTVANPTTIMVKNDTMSLAYGTARRLCRIYIECSPAASATTDLSSTLFGDLVNLSTITAVTASGNSTTGFTDLGSAPTFSTTTITWNVAGAQFAEFIGYYT